MQGFEKGRKLTALDLVLLLFLRIQNNNKHESKTLFLIIGLISLPKREEKKSLQRSKWICQYFKIHFLFQVLSRFWFSCFFIKKK